MILGIRVEIIFSFVMVIATASIAIFAYCQHKFEKTKIKLTCYSRRLEILDATKKFIASIAREGTTDIEKLMEMLRETKHAKFLFKKNDKIVEYINTLYKKGLALEYKEKEIDRNRLGAENREKLIQTSFELKDWFMKQFEVIDSKFEKYLQLP